MTSQPVRFQYSAMAPSMAAEAAARRRMRTMESAFPEVQEWDLRVVGLGPAEDGSACFEARIETRVGLGERLRRQARAGDPLSALRLAFNALELGLEAQRESARARAARWLEVVRSRAGQLSGLGRSSHVPHPLREPAGASKHQAR